MYAFWTWSKLPSTAPHVITPTKYVKHFLFNFNVHVVHIAEHYLSIRAILNINLGSKKFVFMTVKCTNL